jgi:Fe(3+) dicitrate transport protein
MSKTGTLYYSVLDYKPQNQIELYGNVSQNYRSVTFNDIRTVSPSNVIDPNISDEKDLLQTLVYVDNWRQSNFDASIYGLYYNDKIGSMKLVTQMDLLL